MTDIFENSLTLINETLNKMYIKEDENEKFVSVAKQEDTFNETNPSANIYSDTTELDADKEEEKNKLTSQAIEKIKQSLKVSDELQSLLNRIKKINDDIDFNEWKVNEEDNTAILRNKNAYIFKQNDNLCLSHNGIIEIFKSVEELHDWLKKNNYPLPHGIVLHESILNEEEKKEKIQNTPVDWSDDEFIKNEYDYSDAPRLRARYANSRWGDILQHRWADLGKEQTPEDVADALRQRNKQFSRNNPRSNQEKIMRDKIGAKLTSYPYKNEVSVDPGKVWNDLNWSMGNSSDKLDTQLTKNEAIDDNQLDNNEIWYLEYQANDGTDTHYLNANWRDEDLISDNLETAAKFTSRENALKELEELYTIKKTEFPLKPISGINLEECGVTVGGSLGSAVQYLGNKKEESLTEAERDNVKSRNTLNKELVNSANIKDMSGNVIAKPGKTVEEYADNTLLGFSYNDNGTPILTVNGHSYRIADALAKKKVALDFITGKPVGIINNNGKVYGLNGLVIGYSDTREAALNRGIDLDKLAVDTISDDNWQFTQKAGAQWSGSANKLGFCNINNGDIKPKYQAVWNSEPYINNQKLYNNPEILAIMFSGYLDKGPEVLQNRINEINDVFGLNLVPNESLQPAIMNKQRGNNYQQFLKWRDTYYAPLFKQSRLKNKESDKIHNDAENYRIQQDEWRKSANTRADAEKSIQPIVDKMRSINQDFINAKVDGDYVDEAFKQIANNDAIPLNTKNMLANETYEALRTYDNTLAGFFKRVYSDFFKKTESVLTEADSPADFADGPANIASDMAAATTGTQTSTIDTTQTQTPDLSDDIDGYEPEGDNMGSPSFGDINIGGGMGGSPEDMPMPKPENKKIIDVLVNEKDLSQMKLKVKDLDTGKIEIKDLDEITI